MNELPGLANIELKAYLAGIKFYSCDARNTLHVKHTHIFCPLFDFLTHRPSISTTDIVLPRMGEQTKSDDAAHRCINVGRI